MSLPVLPVGVFLTIKEKKTLDCDGEKDGNSKEYEEENKNGRSIFRNETKNLKFLDMNSEQEKFGKSEKKRQNKTIWIIVLACERLK